MFTLPHFSMSIRNFRPVFGGRVALKGRLETPVNVGEHLFGGRAPQKNFFSSPTPLKWQKMFTDLHSRA